MAAQTPATTLRENVGSLTLHIFTFTAVTGADTFASGLGTQVVSSIAQATLAGGTTTGIAGVSATNASGTFTFTTNLAATPVTLWVLSKS